MNNTAEITSQEKKAKQNGIHMENGVKKEEEAQKTNENLEESNFDNRAPNIITNTETDTQKRVFMEDLEANDSLNIKINDKPHVIKLNNQLIAEEDESDDEILTPKSYLLALTFPIIVNNFIMLTAILLYEMDLKAIRILFQKTNVDLYLTRYFTESFVLFALSIIYLAFHVRYKGTIFTIFRVFFLFIYMSSFFMLLTFCYVYIERFGKVYTHSFSLLLLTCLVNSHILVIHCLRANRRFTPSKPIMVSFILNFVILAVQRILFNHVQQTVYELMLIYFIAFLHSFYLCHDFLFILMYRNTHRWALLGNLWVDWILYFPFELKDNNEEKIFSIRIDPLS